MVIWIRRTVWLVLLAGVVFAAYWAFQPQPVLVDVAKVTRGSLQVTVNEDGKTRIKEKYIVSTPVAGRLQRIEFQEGDEVSQGKTVVASIQPGNPGLLDARALAQANARVSAAEAAVGRSTPRRKQAQIDFDQAEREYKEAAKLIQTNSISQKAYDLADTKYRSCKEQLKAAEFDEEIAAYELELAKSALLHVTPDAGSNSSKQKQEFFAIRSPIQGVVLRVMQESTTIVTPGTPIMEVGDATDLEIVVDLLSSDAVKVFPGTKVRIEQWGGKESLEGVVRLVEPSAYLKISALGVEEQRVNVIVDFEMPNEEVGRIGDGYRVEAKLVTWEETDVLKVSTSALFREQNRWAVFVLEDGIAKLTFVELGKRNDQEAQVLKGLKKDQQVILHPGDAITDNTPAETRESAE